MSSGLRNSLLFALCGLALIATAFMATPRRPHADAAHSAEATSSRPLASSLAATPARVDRKFVFDCSPFIPPTVTACAIEMPAEERALLEAVNVYGASPMRAWPPAFADGIDQALAGTSRLDPKKLSPLERAALQNAALFLTVTSSWFEKDKRAQAAGASARILLKRYALSKAEIAALPSTAATAKDWLGEGVDWQDGDAPRFLHTAGDAYARAHRQLLRENTFADVVRLVLVSDSGTPQVSDVVQRISFRRTEPTAVRVCIAELDPMSAGCAKPGGLRALSAERGLRALTPTNAPPCMGCHFDNHPGSAGFGPDTGFALAPAVPAKVASFLAPILRH